MGIFTKYGLNSAYRNYAGALTWLFVIACSTQSPPDQKEHAAQVQRIVTIADSLRGNGPAWIDHFIDSAFRSIPHISTFDIAKKYHYLANYYYDQQRDAAKSGAYADSMLLAITDSTQLPEHIKLYASALLIKGDAAKSESRYNDAISYFYRGRLFMRMTKDTCSFYEYDSRLSTLYYDLGRYKEAVRYYKKTLDVSLHCPENLFTRFAQVQAQLDNIALCYSNMKQYDSALYYYDSALHYIDKYKQQYLNSADRTSRQAFIETAIGVIISNKGQTLLETGDSSTTEQVFRESIRINAQQGHDLADAQNTMSSLASLLLGQHRYKEAGEQLQQLRQSLDQSPSTAAEYDYRKVKWKYYEALGQPELAYATLKSFLRLKDSLNKASELLHSINIQDEFTNISQHYELALLKKQSELKTVYLSIAFVVFVMTLLIILLILKNVRKSRQYVQELGKLNAFVTEQNNQLKKSLSALKQSQQENSRMMRVVAHDLRNPVGGMVAMTEYLEEQHPLINKDSKEPLQLMEAAGGRALNLINELLHLNIPADTLKEPVELDTTLKYCVDILRPKSKEKELQLELHLIPVTVMANREKLWRVFSNLITNAIKFSPSGSTITISMQKEGAAVLVSVKDQGIGIPESFRDKIFSFSPEVKRTGSSGEVSFGLGLSITKQIVEAHKGDIWYESEEGVGTVFYVRLKVTEENAQV
ncbi:MAG: tetratricopeptide repeat-containing sensor histidine kinase [Sediminibacterium magnilacihabitans]|nr:tetratricopeptide repeat-containing sensor histidine kinase [Sediminibacterium magnilacihabitans]PQV61213.1 signal transduction histidine kinase [Sediminibacterium magnilacihabitans]